MKLQAIEPLVNTEQACKALGCGHTYMTQVKDEMGIKGERLFFLSDVERHIRLRLRRRQDHQDVTADRNGGRSSKRVPKTSSL